MASLMAILMGSDSDLPVMQGAGEILRKFGISVERRVTSAHRTSEANSSFERDAEARGCAVFIASAGLAAHLAGAVAAQTLRPVEGVPIVAGLLQGFDALWSTVQMPGGIPVATVAIGKAGAKNAAYLAARIMVVSDDGLKARLIAEREDNTRSIRDKNKNKNKNLEA